MNRVSAMKGALLVAGGSCLSHLLCGTIPNNYTTAHIQRPLEVAEEDDVRAAEIVDAFRSGPSGMVDGPAQLNDGGPNLDIEHAAFIQKQHLPTPSLDF